MLPVGGGREKTVLGTVELLGIAAEGYAVPIERTQCAMKKLYPNTCNKH